MNSELLIQPEELFHILSLPGLIVLDARSREEYEQDHVVDAVSLPPEELEESVTLSNGEKLKHQVCSAQQATEVLRSAGVRDDSRIVVYDAGGSYRAARLFWMLDYFNHGHVQILDGGLDGWREDIGIMSQKERTLSGGNFTPKPQEERRADFFTVITAIGRASKKLCNSLNEDEFANGAIPGSVNLPYHYTFKQGKYPSLRNARELTFLFRKIGNTVEKELICYCGTGYSACQLYFAAKVAGFHRVSVYDGSTAEWTARGGELLPYGGVKK
jgi:thiosulfate/3-mercaptopyruvate sulfurtransferase